MISILFANAYFYRLDPKQWRFKQPYPPLATILAAAVMRNAGYQVSLFDANLRHSPDEIAPHLRKHSPKYFVLYDDGFNYLSKMCLTSMRDAAFTMIAESVKAGCRIIVSSSDATDHATKYFEAGAEYIIRGEGEETLLQLINTLESQGDPRQVTGVVCSIASETYRPRVVMKDLDALPLPAWDLVDIDKYRKIWNTHHGYFALNLATTRGCPFKCNWCAKPIYGNRYNSRSPEHVVAEIEYLLREHKPDYFWMCDDIFGLKPGWVSQFRDLVVSKKLRFRFKIQSRVDLLLESDTISALAEAGLETAWVGAESGSQRILDAMDKGTTVEQIYTATKQLKERDIRVAFFLQFGYLGETAADIRRTMNMLLELMPDEVGISVSYPLPGTKFYDMVKDQLKEKQNWTDSDDLAMMFQSTFQNGFYKQLHRYVHSYYRTRKELASIRKLFARPGSFSSRHFKSVAGIIYFGIQSFVLQRRLRVALSPTPTQPESSV